MSTTTRSTKKRRARQETLSWVTGDVTTRGLKGPSNTGKTESRVGVEKERERRRRKRRVTKRREREDKRRRKRPVKKREGEIMYGE